MSLPRCPAPTQQLARGPQRPAESKADPSCVALLLRVRRNNLHHRTVFTGETLNLWLAHWCDLYGAILVLAVSCFAVGLADDLGAATVGLAFSNTIQMLVFYTWSVRFIAETLFSLAAVEKLGWLAQDIPVEGGATLNAADGPATLPATGAPGSKANIERDGSADLEIVVAAKSEADAGKGGKQASKYAAGDDVTPAAWPRSGTVVFDNVWMKYAPTAPFALKGVTFSLSHTDKVRSLGVSAAQLCVHTLALEAERGGKPLTLCRSSPSTSCCAGRRGGPHGLWQVDAAAGALPHV